MQTPRYERPCLFLDLITGQQNGSLGGAWEMASQLVWTIAVESFSTTPEPLGFSLHPFISAFLLPWLTNTFSFLPIFPFRSGTHSLTQSSVGLLPQPLFCRSSVPLLPVFLACSLTSSLALEGCAVHNTPAFCLPYWMHLHCLWFPSCLGVRVFLGAPSAVSEGTIP